MFFLFFQHFGNLFFYFTYLRLSKNSKHFCGALLYGLQNLSENSGKFFNFYEKNRNTLSTKYFQNSIVYYLIFYYFSIFQTFFFYFTCLWFSKNCKIFVLFYYMDPRFYQKMEIFEIQNFNKIQLFTISFLFFQHFWHFVFYFTYPNLSKNYEIFCSVLLEGLEILPMISGKF